MKIDIPAPACESQQKVMVPIDSHTMDKTIQGFRTTAEAPIYFPTLAKKIVEHEKRKKIVELFFENTDSHGK